MNTPTPRITYYAHALDVVRHWQGVEEFLAKTTIEPTILDLMRMRASQINGCAFCIDMHATDAFKRDITPVKLLMLDAWEESTLFSDRERAALAWTEAITRISEDHAPDDVYELVRSQFSEDEVVALTICAAQINTWNRMAISMRAQPAGKSAEYRAMAKS
jgi:AhpD family alkylhydroperoxidase